MPTKLLDTTIAPIPNPTTEPAANIQTKYPDTYIPKFVMRQFISHYTKGYYKHGYHHTLDIILQKINVEKLIYIISRGIPIIYILYNHNHFSCPQTPLKSFRCHYST